MSTIRSYIIPPAAASLAIIPVYYGFVAKSAKQLGNPIPRFNLNNTVVGGFKAAPTIGAIVGTQMIAQRFIEQSLERYANVTTEPSFVKMFAAAVGGGILSAPALAILNGQTMGQGVIESLSKLTLKQTSLIVIRESSFLFSIRISDPVGLLMRERLGDNATVDYASAFISGAIGSVIGHPADTLLTLAQKGIKVQSWRHMMQGAMIKAVAVGGFSLGYKATRQFFETIGK